MRKPVLVLLSLSFSAPAFAHKDHFDEAPKKAVAEAPKPAAELDKLKGLLGTWKCDGKTPDMGKATQRPVRATMKVARELGGHWLLVEYAEEKTPQNPVPFAFREAIGWDRAASRYQRISIDSMGGTTRMTAGLATADGRLEWSGETQMGDHKAALKDVITLKGDKEASIEVSMQAADGKWASMATMTCRK